VLYLQKDLQLIEVCMHRIPEILEAKISLMHLRVCDVRKRARREEEIRMRGERGRGGRTRGGGLRRSGVFSRSSSGSGRRWWMSRLVEFSAR
jgi:hypothetical protein